MLPFIFAANDPCNICPFPPDVPFSIKAELFGILCVGCVCVVYFSNDMNDPFKPLHNLRTQGHSLFAFLLLGTEQDLCIHFYNFKNI